MAAEKTIDLAIDTVGAGEADDYVISPTKHAEEFKDKAPALATILSSSAVRATARQYEDEDGAALAAQREFRRVSGRANLSVFATGVFVALVMAVGAGAGLLPGWADKTLLVILSMGGVVCGALAHNDLATVRQGGLLEDWMTKRASAETARLDYFERVVEPSGRQDDANTGQLQLFQLEYFRRFQFDVQRAYYHKRSQEHRAEAKKTLSYSGWAVFGAAVATGFTGLLGAAAGSRFAAIGAFGAVFTGLSSFASMREAMNQDRRNAERYERTHRVLNDLYKRLDDVRAAVQAKGAQPLGEFVDAVHEQLSLEHRQWLGQRAEARGAFAKLESTLKELSSQIPGTADGTDDIAGTP
jgi:hypothetical protein